MITALEKAGYQIVKKIGKNTHDYKLKDIVRFMGNITLNEESDCWEWMGAKDSAGYGFIKIGSIVDGTRKQVRTHRLSYAIFNGDLKIGMQIDHICKNTSCCNPKHLDQVTPRENVMRSNNPTSLNAKKTHCKHGHILSDDNVYTSPNETRRRCRKCRSNYEAKRNISNDT